MLRGMGLLLVAAAIGHWYVGYWMAEWLPVSERSIWILWGWAVLSAGVFWLEYSRGRGWLEACQNMLTLYWLAVIGIFDWNTKQFPGALVRVGLLLWAVWMGIWICSAVLETDEALKQGLWMQVRQSVAGGLLVGGIWQGIAFFTKHSVGKGDVWILTVLGLLYGWHKTYWVLCVAVLTMALYCLVLLGRRKVTRKTGIPLVPFLMIGFLSVVIWETVG